MSDLHVVILAAGKGTRMKSARPKVLHHVAGRPMIDYVMRAAQSLSPRTITVVVGHMKELLRQGLERYPELSFVTQEPQLGTGHALLQTAGVLEGQNGFVLLLSGDVPLLKRHTLAEPGEQARGNGRGGHRPDGASSSSPTDTGASSASRDAFRGSSKSATRRRRSGRSRKSTAASTCSRWRRCSTRSGGWPPRTRRASTI